MDELQVAVLGRGGGGVGLGEDTGVAQQLGAARRVVTAEAGEPGGLGDGDVGAEDRGRHRELGGVDAEFLQAVDEASAAGRPVQGAQFGGRGLARRQLAVADLGEEFDGLVRVAVGDRPHLAAEGGLGVVAEGGAGQAGDRGRGQGAEAADGAARGLADGVEVPRRLALHVAGPAGHDDQDRQFVEAFHEGDEPAQGFLVGPVRVVDEQHERVVPPGEPGDGGHEAVAHALRVGVALPGFDDAEGGTGDAEPVAEVLAGLLRVQGHQCGLQQLPHHVEGDGPQCLAAAGRPDRAAAGLGDAARLGQQGGLAESGLAAEHQQVTRGGPVGAECLHRLRDGGDLRVALPQGSRGGRRRPDLRHPATSPSRPNDVPPSSVALRGRARRAVHAGPASTGDGSRRRGARRACGSAPVTSTGSDAHRIDVEFAPRRGSPAGRASGSGSDGVSSLSSGSHRRLIRWGYDAGDSSRVVSRSGADE
ncbi:hypothetical protein QFZ66_001459 [Streptomyces sp. B4I13]|nr:hypothetical protein [Streptomyces sp. B4I13]